jgi:hypothetical protein
MRIALAIIATATLLSGQAWADGVGTWASAPCTLPAASNGPMPLHTDCSIPGSVILAGATASGRASLTAAEIQQAGALLDKRAKLVAMLENKREVPEQFGGVPSSGTLPTINLTVGGNSDTGTCVISNPGPNGTMLLNPCLPKKPFRVPCKAGDKEPFKCEPVLADEFKAKPPPAPPKKYETKPLTIYGQDTCDRAPNAFVLPTWGTLMLPGDGSIASRCSDTSVDTTVTETREILHLLIADVDKQLRALGVEPPKDTSR